MEYFVTIDNIPVHISDTKKGEIPVILLHGYLETLYVFSDFSQLLSPKYRVIAMDIPGHGLSGSHKEINTMEFSAGVVNQVLNLCGIGKAFVAGHSMGGYVAQTFAKLYSQACEGLVLLNSTPFEDSPEKKADRLREIELIQSSKLISLATLSIPKMYAPENLRRLDEKILETIEICEIHDPNGIVAGLKGMMAREDTTSFLENTDLPGLFIFGDKDKFIPLEKAAALIEGFPAFQSAVISGTGHNSFIEAPDKVFEAMDKFMTAVREKK